MIDTFYNGLEISLYYGWLRLHSPNDFINQVRVIA